MVVTTLVLAANAVLCAGLAVVGWRNRGLPGARWFATLEAVSAVWVVLSALALWLPAGAVRLRLWGVVTGVSMVTVPLWLAFILAYTGRGGWLTWRRFGPVAAPLLIGGVLYALVPVWPPLTAGVEQATVPAGTLVRPDIGPFGLALAGYIYLTFAVGFAAVAGTALSSQGLFFGQAAALVGGSLVTIAGSALAIAGVPVRGYPLTQMALGVQSLLWGYAVLRGRLLEVVPAVARFGERAVVRELDDGLLVVSAGGTVLRTNPAAHAAFGVENLVGRDLETLCRGVGVEGLDALPARFSRAGRTYQLKASPVDGVTDQPVGHALLVRDVTGLVQRQQRLQVLNRVLRHNVRNNMNVVLAAADRVGEHGEHGTDRPDLARTIAENARSLTRISEKAIDVERALESTEVTGVDLRSVVRDVVGGLAADHPAATVQTAVDPLVVRTDRRLLALVLREAVENALVHGGEAPNVAVETASVGDAVSLTVRDDGPGVPRTELHPVQAGEETDLEHASSLGLWLIHWGARSLGADLTVETDDGTTVRFEFPADGTDRTPESSADPPPRAAGNNI